MFNKIGNWILGKPATPEKNTAPDNAVDAKKALRDAIVRFLHQKFFGQKTFTDTVAVWVGNSCAAEQSYVRDKEFENELRTDLEDRELKAVSQAKFVFKTENPPLESELPKIAEGVYIQLLAQTVTPIKEICSQAKITVAEGKGSLSESKYMLDADKQTEYNIGRGENNNHIIIKEDDPANDEINNRVSRRHAKIVFVDGKGFCLQSLNENNRTIVNRNNRRIADLTDLHTKVLLQDNDEIELGKSVCLKFEIHAGTKIRKKK